MNDSAEILREYLVLDEAHRNGGQSLVDYLGGAYVACPVAPETFRNEQPCVIFHPETETLHETASDGATTFTFKCYAGSNSYTAARAVYRALVDHLQNARQKVLDSGTLKAAHLITGFQGPAEPETGWPVYVAKFSVVTE